MTLGLHETRMRHRRRARWTVAKWLIGLSSVLAAGVFSYETGSLLARREVGILEDKVGELSASVEQLQKRNTDLQAEIILAQRRFDAANERYRIDVPAGRMAALLDRLEEKLEIGVELERLEFVIDSAQNKRTCDPETTTKRFIVRTPLFFGANDSVGFAKNTVTLTASGASATNADGYAEAWFDPAKSITLHFTEIGGQTVEKKGKLPMHSSLVIGDFEYRYTVIAGPRGFVQVSGDRCRFP